jgi:alcohol dehydrogenase/L-iditol 2-dehydrogenase
MEGVWEHLAVGGTVLILGLDSRPLSLTAQAIVRRQARIIGSLTYDHPRDFESTVALVASGRLAPGVVLSDEHPFDEVQVAFERSASRPGKTWIRIAGADQES